MIINRCDHGNYVPQGETKAPYCTGCDPTPRRLATVCRHRDIIIHERLLDAASYSESSVTDRLTDAYQMQERSA